MSEQVCIPVVAQGSWMVGNLSTVPAPGASVALNCGQWWMASGPYRVSVLTGSGVAVVWWSPSSGLGAVCHCAHPRRSAGDAADGASDGARLDAALVVPEALDEVLRHFVQLGCSREELQLTLVGGAQGGQGSLGADNVASALAWMAANGLRARQMDVGGRVLRRLTVNMGDGTLNVAHGAWLNPSEV